MQAMWDEKFKGHEEFLYSDVRANQDTTLNTWRRGNRRPIVTKYYADKDAIFDNYAYPGGGSVLHMLRKHLGDELFFKSLNHYLTTNAHQPVSTEDLRIAIEETTGQSMDWFFDQWLYRMGHPNFEVTQNYDDAKKQLTLKVKQTQKIDVTNEYPQVEFFQTYVDVEIDNKVERVWIEPKAENTFTFDAASKPKLVNFDYGSSILKELKFEKSTDDLLYQMQNDQDVLGRRWAMSELAKKAKDAEERPRLLTAFLSAAEKDPFWRIRRAALSEAANIVSPDPAPGQPRAAATLDAATETVVLRLAKDPHSLIRSDAIRLLGETKDTKHVALYLAALTDQSYSVIDQASVALALTKSPKAYDALVNLTKTPSWKGRIQMAGFRGLAELEDKRAFDLGYKTATDVSSPGRVRTTALAVVGATGKGDDRAFTLIFDKFKKSLDANDFNGIFSTTEALIKIADPRGQQAFDMLREKFKNQGNITGFVNLLESRFKAALK